MTGSGVQGRPRSVPRRPVQGLPEESRRVPVPQGVPKVHAEGLGRRSDVCSPQGAAGGGRRALRVQTHLPLPEPRQEDQVPQAGEGAGGCQESPVGTRDETPRLEKLQGQTRRSVPGPRRVEPRKTYSFHGLDQRRAYGSRRPTPVPQPRSPRRDLYPRTTPNPPLTPETPRRPVGESWTRRPHRDVLPRSRPLFLSQSLQRGAPSHLPVRTPVVRPNVPLYRGEGQVGEVLAGALLCRYVPESLPLKETRRRVGPVRKVLVRSTDEGAAALDVHLQGPDLGLRHVPAVDVVVEEYPRVAGRTHVLLVWGHGPDSVLSSLQSPPVPVQDSGRYGTQRWGVPFQSLTRGCSFPRVPPTPQDKEPCISSSNPDLLCPTRNQVPSQFFR